MRVGLRPRPHNLRELVFYMRDWEHATPRENSGTDVEFSSWLLIPALALIIAITEVS